MIRLNKYLSQCGVSSRRGADKLIEDGRVTVNDEPVIKTGKIIDETRDIIKVDGSTVKPIKKKYYVVLNKPRNVLTTLSDPFRRKTVGLFVRKLQARVYPVGRLDFDTEGVLVMTNDGDLAYRLAHPKYQITRIYHAIVDGIFTSEKGSRIADGITLEDGHIGKAKVKIISAGLDFSKVEVIITEGHKREIKQLMKAVGNPVKRLVRMEFAGIRVDNLKRGRWRHLKRSEVSMLRNMVELTDEWDNETDNK